LTVTLKNPQEFNPSTRGTLGCSSWGFTLFDRFPACTPNLFLLVFLLLPEGFRESPTPEAENRPSTGGAVRRWRPGGGQRQVFPEGLWSKPGQGSRLTGRSQFTLSRPSSSRADPARVSPEGLVEKEVVESAGTLCLELASSSTGDKAQSPGGVTERTSPSYPTQGLYPPKVLGSFRRNVGGIASSSVWVLTPATRGCQPCEWLAAFCC